MELVQDTAFNDWVLVKRGANRLEFRDTFDIPPRGDVTTFSGVAVVQGRVVEGGDEAFEVDTAQLVQCQGQFTCVVELVNSVLVANDFYGFQSIFYYDGHHKGQSIFVVSNRYVSLVHYLRGLGVALTLDDDYFANQVFSTQSFFQQVYAHRTACREIRLLPVDRVLSLEKRRIVAIQKPLFQAAFDRRGKYEDWIDEAADSIIRDTQLLLEDPRISLIKQSLSGGRDSRLVLGLALRIGLGERLRIYTEDVPSNPNDLRIAASLVSKYNLAWYEGDGRGQFPITPQIGVSIWQHFQSNLYHRVGFASHISAGSNRSAIELTGGGGEVFRAFWSPFARRRGITPESHPSDSLKAHSFLVMVDAIPDALRGGAEEAFIESIAQLPGGNLLEQFDNHYLFFRNRTHFGGSDLRAYLGNMTWHPIASPQLLAASRVVGDARRESSEILYDLQERLTPALNDLEFDKSPWQFRADKPIREHDIAVPEGDVDGWGAADLARRRDLDVARAGKPARFTPADVSDFMRNEIVRLAGLISSHGENSLLWEAFDAVWSSKLLPDPKTYPEMVSKLQSAAVIFDEPGLWAGQYKLIEVSQSGWFRRLLGRA